MEKDRQTSEKDSAESLFSDLQQMIEEELGEAAPKDSLKKVFRPLTDGLGLESPQRSDMFFDSYEENKDEAAVEAPPARSTVVQSHTQAAVAKAETQKKVKSLREALPDKEMAAPEEKIVEIPVESSKHVTPPPMPRPSIFRRILSAIIDEIFVMTLWLIAMVITLRLLTGSFVGLTAANTTVVGDPQFLRFAVLEFVALWLAYLVVCIGVLDMTFGMWIWNIRVGYGSGTESPGFGKKILRALLSFLFYVPVAPLILLVVAGKQGRNLLDLLSGTRVYKTVG